MKTKQKGFTVVELATVILFIVSAIGWVWNIIKIVAAISDPINLLLVLRCIGVVVAPLGVVLGFL